MATYYRWRKSTPKYTDFETKANEFILGPFKGSDSYHHDITRSNGNTYSTDGIYYILDNEYATEVYSYGSVYPDGGSYFQYVVTPPIAGKSNIMYKASGSSTGGRIYVDDANNVVYFAGQGLEGTKYTRTVSPGTSQGYVYSTSSSAYPNGGVQGGYYYDQRTTVESPTAPTGLTYPNPITTPTVTVSWDAATSNTDYPVDVYGLYYAINGSELWTSYPTSDQMSVEFTVPSGAQTIRFQIRAKDTNGQYSSYTIGDWATVYLAPTLTVPQMVMQGQNATINWSAVEGVDSYTLQRKANTDTDWTQVYSGTALTFSETVGTWTSLQYRVQAVFDGTPGGWATSNSIQIVSASSLVISGQDGDLGTLTSDVPYSISSDQTSPTIDVTVEVNGGEYASFQATSGQTYKVSVLDLPTGTGNIAITATTEVSSSPVTVTRSWTYSKTAQTFPNSGSVAALTKEGNVVYPETLPEAVRTPMNPWGGNLGTALNHLKNAALFNRTKQPKYSEVTIDLSTLTQTDAQNGKIINLPYKGVMIPHRVVHIGNPDPELYDASCNGVRGLREGIVEDRMWNATEVNVLPNNAIMQIMAGYVENYDTAVRSAIKTVKIPYCVGNGSATVNSGPNGLECKIFPLGLYELGLITSDRSSIPQDGAKLDYFVSGTDSAAHIKRSAEKDYYTRSPRTDISTHVWRILALGQIADFTVTGEFGYRPAFLLPTTFSATYYVDTQGTIHDQQEYTEAGEWLDVWGNAIPAVPAVKIETGSYVGTGTYGQSNPNTLTFPFEPKVVFVCQHGEASGTLIPMMNPNTISIGIRHGISGYVSLTVSWGDKSVSWYGESHYNQFNYNGYQYDYVAIG